MKLKHFITATVITAIACIGLLVLWTYIPYYPYVTTVVNRIAKSIVFFILLAHNIITTEYFTGKMNIPKDNMKLKILFSLSVTMLTIMAITVLIGLVFTDSDDNMSILTGGIILYYGIPIETVILIILIVAFQTIKKKHENKDE